MAFNESVVIVDYYCYGCNQMVERVDEESCSRCRNPFIEEQIGGNMAPIDRPQLTPQMDNEIDNALESGTNVLLVKHETYGKIYGKDILTLKGLNRLNDEIIDFYMSLIVERGKNDNFRTVHAFNTFFYKKIKDNGPQSLKRWTRKLDVFANDYIFIPIHLGMHWCLAVIDLMNKRIQYYDSMGGTNMGCVQSLFEWLSCESVDKKKVSLQASEWVLEMALNIPQQINARDCGMFVCKFAEYISRDATITFTQAHMPYFRRRMVYEILNKRLL